MINTVSETRKMNNEVETAKNLACGIIEAAVEDAKAEIPAIKEYKRENIKGYENMTPGEISAKILTREKDNLKRIKEVKRDKKDGIIFINGPRLNKVIDDFRLDLSPSYLRRSLK